MSASSPILYSFRRCPYAIRARLAIDVSGQSCELREVALRKKPDAMLRASPKGTVPVLIDEHGAVLDESIDIMLWALRRNDPEGWLSGHTTSLDDMLSVIGHFDTHFKAHLDRYKYPNRYADANAHGSRDAAIEDLETLEGRLAEGRWLCGERVALLDMALAPFVRQFANVDAAWFASQPWLRLQHWLQAFVDSPRFVRVMRAVDPWTPATNGIPFPFDAPCDRH